MMMMMTGTSTTATDASYDRRVCTWLTHHTHVQNTNKTIASFLFLLVSGDWSDSNKNNADAMRGLILTINSD